MDIRQQTERYWTSITTRKRNPIKGSTRSSYNSYIQNWILPELGAMQVADVENGVVKALVAKLAESGLSAATIAGITNCVKGIVASCQDQNGNQLYPRTWNNDFIDAPLITDQKTPIITALEAHRAISTTSGQYRPFFALLAGSGLRIGEIRALRGAPVCGSSYWDANRAVLAINRAIYNGKEQSTKTTAGVREVDLHPDLNRFMIETLPNAGTDYLFQSEANGPIREKSARRVLKDLGIPGFHSFRRFRITHLEAQNVPLSLMNFWAGHADKTVHDRYVKIGRDIQVRREWAEKAGLGFEL